MAFSVANGEFMTVCKRSLSGCGHFKVCFHMNMKINILQFNQFNIIYSASCAKMKMFIY